MNDYYKILEIEKNANLKTIKQSYISLARQYHPDRNNSKNAEKKFKEIQEAYEVLSDVNSRKEYDLYGNIHVYNRRKNSNKNENSAEQNTTKKNIKLKKKFLFKKIGIVFIIIILLVIITNI